MKTMFKKMFASTLILATVSVAQPQKAEAFAVFMTAGWVTLGYAPKPVAVPVGTSMIALGAASLATGIYLLAATPYGFAGAMLIVLDADGSPAKSDILNALSQKYTFVDNSEALNDLAVAMKEKAKVQSKDDAGNIRVSFSEKEVAQIMASADLTDAQLKTIAADLAP